jgi:hypothetical protein
MSEDAVERRIILGEEEADKQEELDGPEDEAVPLDADEGSEDPKRSNGGDDGAESAVGGGGGRGGSVGAGGAGGGNDDGGGGNGGGTDGGGRDRRGGGRRGGTRTVSLNRVADRTLDLTDQTERVGVDPGTFLQRSGVSLFLKVLLVTSIIVFALFINLMAELAQVPRAPSGTSLTNAFTRGDTTQTLRLAAHYRAVSEVAILQRDAAWSHFVLGVKELIVAVFLPLMTGILGYIFGTRSEGASGGGDPTGSEG